MLLRGDAKVPYKAVRTFFKDVQDLGFGGVSLAVGAQPQVGRRRGGGLAMGASLNTGFKKAKVQPEMNVTPLVDVVLVLLIIFMVLAPVMAKSFWVRLPPKDDKEEQLDQANDPDKPLVLSVAADGKTSINKIEVDRAELTEKLTRMFNRSPRTTRCTSTPPTTPSTAWCSAPSTSPAVLRRSRSSSSLRSPSEPAVTSS